MDDDLFEDDEEVDNLDIEADEEIDNFDIKADEEIAGRDVAGHGRHKFKGLKPQQLTPLPGDPDRSEWLNKQFSTFIVTIQPSNLG